MIQEDEENYYPEPDFEKIEKIIEEIQDNPELFFKCKPHNNGHKF